MKNWVKITLIISLAYFTIFSPEVNKISDNSLKVLADNSITGPLKVYDKDHHYFIDNKGNKITLIGLPGSKFNNMNVKQADYYKEIDDLAGADPTQVLNYLRLWTVTPWTDKGGVRYPWQEIGTNYATDYKFDLTKWDTTYWTNLKDYVSHAQSKGIYVDYIIFDEVGLEGCIDGHTDIWKRNPFNPQNNINNLGLQTNTGTPYANSNLNCPTSGNGFYDYWGSNSNLEKVQKAYVTKLLTELKDYNNVLFEITNEYSRGDDTWEKNLAAYTKSQISATQSKSKLVFADHLRNLEDKYTYQWSDPNIDGYNFHLTTDAAGLADRMKTFYPYNKPVNNNEPSLQSTKKSMYETAFTMFATGGHVSFDDAKDENNSGDARDEMLDVAKKLSRFVNGVKVKDDEDNLGVKFWTMKPNNGAYNSGKIYVSAPPSGTKAYSLVNPGNEYVVVLSGSTSGTTSMTIDLSGLPTGKIYRAVSYRPDTDTYLDLNITYDSVASSVNSIPSFSGTEVIYIRAINDPSSPISITQSVNTSVATSGNTLTFSVIAKNNSTVIQNVTLKDPVDSTYLESIVPSNSGTITTDRNYPGKAVVIWPSFSLAAGAQVTYTVKAKIKSANPTLISGLSVTSGKTYQVTKLSAGKQYYIDRTYTLKSLPQELISSDIDWIKTANNDKTQNTSNFMSFKLSEPAYIYTAYDSRTPIPSWLSGWSKLSSQIIVQEKTGIAFNVYQKQYPAGNVTLGANNGNSASSMYFVAAQKVRPAIISDLKVINEKQYRIDSDPRVGDTSYVDRSYVFTSLPAEITSAALDLIMSANDDKLVPASTNFLSFNLTKQSMIYVLYDSTIGTTPSWLQGWTKLSSTVSLNTPNSTKFTIYSKTFSPGTVSLGGNGGTSASCMYFVTAKIN